MEHRIVPIGAELNMLQEVPREPPARSLMSLTKAKLEAMNTTELHVKVRLMKERLKAVVEDKEMKVRAVQVERNQEFHELRERMQTLQDGHVEELQKAQLNYDEKVQQLQEGHATEREAITYENQIKLHALTAQMSNIAAKAEEKIQLIVRESQVEEQELNMDLYR